MFAIAGAVALGLSLEYGGLAGGPAKPPLAKYASSVAELVEPAAVKACDRISSLPVTLPGSLATKPVDATFIRTTAMATTAPPVVLLHSFDSSCLEFRRVLPLLDNAKIEAWALDTLGWGFIETSGNVKSVSVEAKREYLHAFQQQVLDGRPAVFVGTSLGAATIIDFAAEYPEAVAATVLVDPQGFIDGAPPVPEPLAAGGVELLGSWPLRWLGQLIAYEDTNRCATDDAIRVGRLHCARDGWAEDSVAWLLGGGYSVSSLVPKLASAGSQCVVLWGRQDRVLPASDYIGKFVSALPEATYRWVENCGHVPHLEQPSAVAAAIEAVVYGNAAETPGDGDVSAFAGCGSSDASPLAQLNAFLDRPLLDTSERGGPLEPFKRYARINPEEAQVAASVVAVVFFAGVGRVMLAVVAGI